jgi:diaminopimelate decarboxylase
LTTIQSGERSSDEQMKLNYAKIFQLESEHGSSFYLLDVDKLKGNYRKMEEAFTSQYPKCIIGYSYKTNYLPFLCKELSSLGAYAEVVSRLEYDLAVKIGENPERIIFNGPVKTKDDIFKALHNKSILNIDSLYEIEYVKEYCFNHPEEMIKIGLRLNFPLLDGGESLLQDGYEVGRFGICVENGNLQTAINMLSDVRNVKIVGLHGHFSTKTRSVKAYRLITKKLCVLAKHFFKYTLEYIDIGGGFYGELPKGFHFKAPSFNDYAEAIGETMNKEFAGWEKKPLLIIEPGISMVANVFRFAAKVIEVKNVRDKTFVLVDGSVHNIKPTMHKNNLPMQVITQNEGGNRNSQKTFSIVGYTCMEKDYLAHNVVSPIPCIGDYVLFDNVGAYTIVFNPPFIKERPAVIAIKDGETIVARKKETIKEFFNEALYLF